MMLDTKDNSRHCAYCMTNSGGPAWLLGFRRKLAAASDASNMKAFMPKPQCDQSLLPYLWSCCMLTYQPDQTAKTVAKFLWQGYISIFRVLPKLLSDQGANLESNIIRELCELMGIWKVSTSPYNAQSSGQVE